MSGPQWTEAPGEWESLALSSRAVLAGAEAERPYDELVSILGLGALTVAVADECRGVWSTYARDAALPAAAGMLGLRLRDLHPPAAALGLERSAEFLQHFRDSYVPLMRRALASGQALLVWCGWPPPAEREWGVVVEMRGEELRGHTIGSHGQLVTLSGPSLQVYEIEGYEPPDAALREPAALLAHVARTACDGWHSKLPVADGIVTGERAYDVWRELSSPPRACPCGRERPGRCQVEMIRSLVSARQCLAKWLRRTVADLDATQREITAEWAGVCDRVADRLRAFTDDSAGIGRCEEPSGCEELVRAIDDVCRLEAGIVARLEQGCL